MRPPAEPPSWELFRYSIRSRQRPAWDTAGLWSLDVLEATLGGNWLEETWQLRQRLGESPLLPAEIAASSGYPMHFAELLELGLRLTRFGRADGIDQLKTDLRANKQHHRWMHSRLQLELGSLLLSVGLEPRFEQPLPGGLPHQGDADVLFNVDGQEIVVSAYTLYPTDVFRESVKQSDRLFDGLMFLHNEHRVGIRAEIAPEIDDEEEALLLDEVRAAMKMVAETGQRQQVATPSAAAEITPPSSGGETDFYVGARSPEQNLWPRIVRQLEKKAAALACEAPVWVRADLRDGVWQTTPWATWTLEQRLPELEQALRAAFDPMPTYLGGFVLSSGAVRAPGEVTDETARTDSGAVALRYPIAPLRGRELVIVPFGDSGTAKVFESAYADESGWLPAALNAAGLPALGDLFPAPPAATPS